MKKFYSLNDEDYNINDLDELMWIMNHEGNLKVGTVYYEAVFRTLNADDLNCVDYVIENMEDILYDLVGDSVDSLDIITEAINDLKKRLDDWIVKYTNIEKFYTIHGSPIKCEITEDDVSTFLSKRN